MTNSIDHQHWDTYWEAKLGKPSSGQIILKHEQTLQRSRKKSVFCSKNVNTNYLSVLWLKINIWVELSQIKYLASNFTVNFKLDSSAKCKACNLIYKKEGTSQLLQFQSKCHQILVTSEISYLATSAWVRCWDKVTPGWARLR